MSTDRQVTYEVCGRPHLVWPERTCKRPTGHEGGHEYTVAQHHEACVSPRCDGHCNESPLPAECCEGVCDGIPHDDDCETPLWEEIDRLKRERDEAITALHQLYKHDRIADARRILFDAGRLDCDTKAGSDCA